MTYKECIACKFLPICQITSTPKILSHFVCEHYQEVENPVQVVKARCDIINAFGSAGIQAIASYKKEPNG